MVDLVNVIPIEISDRQMGHYLQYVKSCEFNAYDYGFEGNMQKYQNPYPPSYDLDKIQPKTPIELYYSDNDLLVTIQDIQYLSEIMGNRVSLNRVKFSKFNHFDFIIAKNIKEVINSCIVNKIDKFEGRAYAGSVCTPFQNEPF